MRRYGMLVGYGAVALLMCLMVSEAQVSGGKKDGGINFGFAGDKTVMLLHRADVKKELEVTDEQMGKIPVALMKAIGEVLNDKQMKRFRQIDLQVTGLAAFGNEKFRKELSVTESQYKKIDEIRTDHKKQLNELLADAKASGFKGVGEKVAGLGKEAKENVFAVLTADQKKAYKALVGEEFKFEQVGKKKVADTSDK
jgi:hypothetical protein